MQRGQLRCGLNFEGSQPQGTLEGREVPARCPEVGMSSQGPRDRKQVPAPGTGRGKGPGPAVSP